MFPLRFAINIFPPVRATCAALWRTPAVLLPRARSSVAEAGSDAAETPRAQKAGPAGRVPRGCAGARKKKYLFSPFYKSMGKQSNVCFFVLCKRHWIHRVPGAPWGFPVYTLHLNSDAGYAVLPLTLLGAPVSIGEALG